MPLPKSHLPEKRRLQRNEYNAKTYRTFTVALHKDKDKKYIEYILDQRILGESLTQMVRKYITAQMKRGGKND